MMITRNYPLESLPKQGLRQIFLKIGSLRISSLRIDFRPKKKKTAVGNWMRFKAKESIELKQLKQSIKAEKDRITKPKK